MLQVFWDRDTLAMHIISHTNDQSFRKAGRAQTYPCQYCGDVFSYEDMLLLHIMSSHKSNRAPLDLSSKSRAPKRPYSADSETSILQSHMLSKQPIHLVRPQAESIWRKPISIPPSQILDHCDKTQTSALQPPPMIFPLTADQMYIAAARFRSEAIGQSMMIPPQPVQPIFPNTRESASSCSPHSTQSKTEEREPSTSPLKEEAIEEKPDVKRPGSLMSVTEDCTSTSAVESCPNSPAGRSESVPHTGPDVLQKLKDQDIFQCIHCDIFFLDRAMFHLHSGLHNHNSPWQCNICGKKCNSKLEFSAHVIHS